MVTPLEREKDLTSSYSKEKGEAQTQTQTQTQTQKQRKVKGQEMTPQKKNKAKPCQIKLKIIFGEDIPKKKKEQIALENKFLAADDVTIMCLYV